MQRLKETLVSNSTFQHILHKLGADSRNPLHFSKKSSNAFEVFLEAFGRLVGDESADSWVDSLFAPIVHCIVS
jgi:hypothetical protein